MEFLRVHSHFVSPSLMVGHLCESEPLPVDSWLSNAEWHGCISVDDPSKRYRTIGHRPGVLGSCD